MPPAGEPLVSVVMPCLNEAETRGDLHRARRARLWRAAAIAGEVIVADNGSTDGSPAIADARRRARRPGAASAATARR